MTVWKNAEKELPEKNQWVIYTNREGGYGILEYEYPSDLLDGHWYWTPVPEF